MWLDRHADPGPGGRGGTWETCADATPSDATEVRRVDVLAPDVAAAVRGAYAGLVGRAGREGAPGVPVERAALDAEEAPFSAAVARLRRQVRQVASRGRGGAVVGAIADADRHVLARDGDRS